mmetsp:Transcript_73951/g.204890  ORF Transcript_73951/g.204890 Transcript_73951/m.204890 type:complete len:212 (+) Transcript_73951:124-759(+)
MTAVLEPMLCERGRRAVRTVQHHMREVLSQTPLPTTKLPPEGDTRWLLWQAGHSQRDGPRPRPCQRTPGQGKSRQEKPLPKPCSSKAPPNAMATKQDMEASGGTRPSSNLCNSAPDEAFQMVTRPPLQVTNTSPPGETATPCSASGALTKRCKASPDEVFHTMASAEVKVAKRSPFGKGWTPMVRSRRSGGGSTSVRNLSPVCVRQMTSNP